MKAKYLLIGLALAATTASAQYPTRPITSVVGFAPGGGTDTVSRIVARTLGDQRSPPSSRPSTTPGPRW